MWQKSNPAWNIESFRLPNRYPLVSPIKRGNEKKERFLWRGFYLTVPQCSAYQKSDLTTGYFAHKIKTYENREIQGVALPQKEPIGQVGQSPPSWDVSPSIVRWCSSVAKSPVRPIYGILVKAV